MIVDFVAGGVDDAVRLDAGVSSYQDAMQRAAQVGANTVFTFGPGQTLTLSNVALSNLTAADFSFATPAETQPRARRLGEERPHGPQGSGGALQDRGAATHRLPARRPVRPGREFHLRRGARARKATGRGCRNP